MEIKIYTNPHCPFSENAKRFLKKRKLKFEEISLFKNAEARLEIVELSGQMATPVIILKGETIIGFDEPALKDILKKKK
jgi:glutaredoxin